MKWIIPLLFIAGCGRMPEPVGLPYDNGVSLPLRVCDSRSIVRQAVRHVNWQMPGAIEERCPGNVSIDLAGAEYKSGGLAEFEDGTCYITLTRVGPFERSWVLAHELGHCLGLADDPDLNTQMADPYDPENMPSDRFSDRDRRYVRRRLP